MDLHKQILFLAICTSLPAAIIGMKNNNFDCGDAIQSIAEAYAKQKTLASVLVGQTDNMISFVRDHKQNRKSMLYLGMWLINQRNNIAEAKTWNILVEQLRMVMYQRIDTHCDHNETQKALAVMVAVISIAHDLEPYQNCLTPLIQRTTDAIKEAESWLPTTKDLIPLLPACQNTNFKNNT